MTGRRWEQTRNLKQIHPIREQSQPSQLPVPTAAVPITKSRLFLPPLLVATTLQAQYGATAVFESCHMAAHATWPVRRKGHCRSSGLLFLMLGHPSQFLRDRPPRPSSSSPLLRHPRVAAFPAMCLRICPSPLPSALLWSERGSSRKRRWWRQLKVATATGGKQIVTDYSSCCQTSPHLALGSQVVLVLIGQQRVLVGSNLISYIYNFLYRSVRECVCVCVYVCMSFRTPSWSILSHWGTSNFYIFI